MEGGSGDRVSPTNEELTGLMERFEATLGISTGDEVKEGGGRVEEADELTGRVPVARHQESEGEFGEGLNPVINNFANFIPDDQKLYQVGDPMMVEINRSSSFVEFVGRREELELSSTVSMKEECSNRLLEGGVEMTTALRPKFVPEVKSEPSTEESLVGKLCQMKLLTLADCAPRTEN
jgi:hypothetical protein